MGQFRIDYIKNPRGKDQSTVTRLTEIYLMTIAMNDPNALDELVDSILKAKQDARK